MVSEYEHIVGKGLVSPHGVFMGMVTEIDARGLILNGGPSRLNYYGDGLELFYKVVEIDGTAMPLRESV